MKNLNEKLEKFLSQVAKGELLPVDRIFRAKELLKALKDAERSRDE